MPEIFSSQSKSPTGSTTVVSKDEVHPPKKNHSEAKPHIVHHRSVDEYSEVMRHEHPNGNPLAAYSPKPHNAHFESQAESEHVVLLLRRHPITNLSWIFLTVLLLIAPIILQFVPFITFFPSMYQTVVLLGWYMIVFAYALEKFLTWFFNVMIITDERIVDIDFENLIYKRVSSAKIDNIEDITGTTGGFIRSLLNFGTVIVQTAGVEQEFDFHDIPHPDRVIKLLNELLLEEEREVLEGRVN